MSARGHSGKVSNERVAMAGVRSLQLREFSAGEQDQVNGAVRKMLEIGLLGSHWYGIGGTVGP